MSLPAVAPIPVPVRVDASAMPGPFRERDTWVTEAALRGLDADTVHHVLLVGAPSPPTCAALATTFPNLARIVVFEPRLDVRAKLGDQPVAVPRELIVQASPLTGDGASRASVCWSATEALRSCAGAIRRTVVLSMEPDAQALKEFMVALAEFVDPFAAAVADRLLESPLDDAGRACLLEFAAQLREDGDAYRALTLLLALHRVDPSAVAPTKIALCWQALDCFGPAAVWLSRTGLPMHVLQEAHDQLAAAAVEARAAEQRQAERNLAHLRVEFPELAEALERTQPFDGEVAWVRGAAWIYELRKPAAIGATYPLLLRSSGDGIESLNPPTRPRDWYRLFANLTDPRSSHVAIGSTSALGSLLAMLRNPVSSNLINWRQIVYVLEPDLAVMHRMIGVFDYRLLLTRDKVQLYWGSDAAERFVDDFVRHPMRIIPSIRARLPAEVDARLHAVELQRRRAAADAVEHLRSIYTEERVDRLRHKLERGEPLRVWGLSSLHTSVLQYVVSDLLAAFRQLGHRTKLMIEHDAGEKAHGYAIAVSLAKFEPDVIVLCDHLRPEMDAIFPPHLPSLVWILDEMPKLNDPEIIAKLSPTDLSFPLSREWTERYLSLGYPHAAYLPFAANPDRCQVGDDLEPVDAVAFATHLCHPNEFRWAPGFLARLREALEHATHAPWDLEAQRTLVEHTIDDLGLSLSLSERESLHFQGFLLSRDLDRIAVVDALLAAGIPIALYGRGWERIARFAAYARGVVQPGPELGRLYRGYKVVLHINQTCNLHVRVLEAISVGGFVLARSAGPLDEGPDGVGSALALGEELCLFADLDDLVQKVRRAFTDEAWRQALIQRGQRRVLQEHGYRARVHTMLDELSRRVGAAALGNSD